jgi:DnaK suppressor protein
MTQQPTPRLRAFADRLRVDLARLRAQVRAERDDLDQATEIEAMDFGDQAARAEQISFHGGVADRDAQRMRVIYEALLRIQNGTFGQCVQCNGDIDEARLLAEPETPLCIVCAQQIDDRAEPRSAY